CASQVYFDGIFSPCLKAGVESSSADAACAISNPPTTSATVRHVCLFMDLLCRGSVNNKLKSYGGPQIASNGRAAPMPLGRLLECVGQGEDLRFTETRPRDLQADGQSAATEAARDRDRRQPEDVERLRVAKRRCDSTRCRHCRN